MLHSDDEIAVLPQFFFSVKDLFHTPLLNLVQLVQKYCLKKKMLKSIPDRYVEHCKKKSAPNLVFLGRNVRSKLKMA